MGDLIGAAGAVIGIMLAGNFLSNKFSKVSPEMQGSIAKQGIALAIIAGGASMLYKTLKMIAFRNGLWWY